MHTAFRPLDHRADDPRNLLRRVLGEHNSFEAVWERDLQIHSGGPELEVHGLTLDDPLLHDAVL